MLVMTRRLIELDVNSTASGHELADRNFPSRAGVLAADIHDREAES